MGGNGQDGQHAPIPVWEQRWQTISALVVAHYRKHLIAFIAINVTITVLNIVSGPPWWGLWPLLITGLIFTFHLLMYKAITVDEAWVNERAGELYDKSYDQGHIASIADRHEMETPIERAIREDAAARKAREAKRKPKA